MRPAQDIHVRLPRSSRKKKEKKEEKSFLPGYRDGNPLAAEVDRLRTENAELREQITELQHLDTQEKIQAANRKAERAQRKLERRQKRKEKFDAWWSRSWIGKEEPAGVKEGLFATFAVMVVTIMIFTGLWAVDRFVLGNGVEEETVETIESEFFYDE